MGNCSDHSLRLESVSFSNISNFETGQTEQSSEPTGYHLRDFSYSFPPSGFRLEHKGRKRGRDMHRPHLALRHSSGHGRAKGEIWVGKVVKVNIFNGVAVTEL